MALRVGFIGTGGIAQVHLQSVKNFDGAEVTAVCDVQADRAKAASEQYGGRPYTHYKEMLQTEKLDVLFVCVPPAFHGTIEEDACALGIHLFVEKPLGLSMTEVRRKAEAIQQAGLITASGYCLRYQKPTEIARQWLGDEPIGMIVGQYLTSMPGAPWWRVRAQSGGQLVEQSTHTLDLARYFGGDVTSVTAIYSDRNMKGDVENFDIWDSGVVTLQFASGIVGAITNTCLLPPGNHASTLSLHTRRLGTIEIEGGQAKHLQAGRTVTERAGGNMYQVQDHTFLAAVASGDRSQIRSDYFDAMKTLAVTLAANESALQGGRPVNPNDVA